MITSSPAAGVPLGVHLLSTLQLPLPLDVRVIAFAAPGDARNIPTTKRLTTTLTRIILARALARVPDTWAGFAPSILTILFFKKPLTRFITPPTIPERLLSPLEPSHLTSRPRPLGTFCAYLSA